MAGGLCLRRLPLRQDIDHFALYEGTAPKILKQRIKQRNQLRLAPLAP